MSKWKDKGNDNVPVSTVYVGELSASTIVPLFHADETPYGVRHVRITVDTDFDVDATNYWNFEVVIIDDRDGTISWRGPRFSLAEDSLRAYKWHEVLSDAGTLSEETLGLAATKIASGGNLGGLAVCFERRER